jgi:ribulose-phosphate 3-epimerase
MIEHPERYLEDFARAGATALFVHPEAALHLHRTLGVIHDLGVQAGVALNPSTSEEVLEYVLPLLDEVLVMTVNPGFGGQSFIRETLPRYGGYVSVWMRQAVRRVACGGWGH